MFTYQRDAAQVAQFANQYNFDELVACLTDYLDPKAASGTRAGIGNDDEASVDEGLIYIPARRNGGGTLMFEDLWPAYGDFDFNDFVVNYKIQLYMQNKNKVNAMLIGVRVKAVGGSIPYDLCLAMKGVKGGEIDEIEPYNSKNAPEAE